jgi:hypothetical protein
MKNVLAICLSIAIAVSATSAPAPKTPIVPDYFPTVKGTTWEYIVEGTDNIAFKREMMSVETKDGAKYAIMRRDNTSAGRSYFNEYRIDDTGISWTGTGSTESEIAKFASSQLFINPKAKKGDEWTFPDRNDGTDGQMAKMIFVGIEEVETPAGKFKAIAMIQESSTGKTTSWYASGVGLVKRKNADGTFDVLKSFSLGKK